MGVRVGAAVSVGGRGGVSVGAETRGEVARGGVGVMMMTTGGGRVGGAEVALGAETQAVRQAASNNKRYRMSPMVTCRGGCGK